jgi:membrane AbrB-like protein
VSVGRRRQEPVLLKAALTLVIAALGGSAFFAIGVPAPWLSGPAVSVGTAGLAGAGLWVPERLRYAALVVLGATMGSAVTPETVGLFIHWPLSLAGLGLSVFLIMLASSVYLERVHGFDRATARLASVPGALPYVLALVSETRGDCQRIIIVQMVRLTALVLLLPTLLTALGSSPAPIANHAAQVKVFDLAILLTGGIVGSWLFTLLRAPAAPMFGSMAVSAVLCGTGLVASAIPLWLLAPWFVVVGATVGTNFTLLDRTLLADTIAASLGSLVVGAAVAISAAVPVSWLLGIPVAKVWLAYAPGGVDVMTIMAVALGLDPAFVGGHHLARFLGLGLFVPIWLRGDLRSRDAR